jgi:hypothetical protein
MTAGKPVVEFFDVEQGSDEWFDLRRGIPTASKFKAVMANALDGEPSTTRAKYLLDLAGEILTGITAEDHQNEYMRRGQRMEPLALDWYERTHFIDLQRIGFARLTISPAFSEPFAVGCSPDAYSPELSRVIEVKTTMPRLMIPIAEKGAAGFPTQHRAQCQGMMWITGAQTCDLILFYEGWKAPLKFRVDRDENYIANMASQIEIFVHELRTKVLFIRLKDKAWGPM